MEKEVFINGRKIAYFEEGEGFPFLIIHGWGEFDAAKSFLIFQKLLAKEGFKVYLPNLPGFIGSTAPLSDDWGMKDYAESILRFLEKVEVKDFYLLGQSGGGALAIHLTAKYPERVKALILCSPGIMGSKATPLKIIQLCIFYLFVYGSKIGKIILSPLLLVLKKIYRASDKYLRLEKLVKWLREHEKFYFKDKMLKIIMRIGRKEETVYLLKQIRTPTLIVWGKRDFFNPLRAAPDIRRLPNHRLEILPRVGHSPQKTCPEKLVELITDFIKNLEDKEVKDGRAKKKES